MIGLAKSCKGGTALANYVMKPEKGYELDRNLVSGDTPTEILQEMRPIQDLNQRAEKRTLSLVLSPHVDDGRQLSDDDLKKMVKDFMRELGVDPKKQQYVAFVHTEKAHKHIHILANRVKDNGKLINDSYIGKRAQWAAHRVAKKYGLTSAKEKMIKNLNSKKHQTNLEKVVKNEIRKKHNFVVKYHPESMQEYFQMMAKLNVKVTPTINKSGRVQGMRMKDLATDKDFKASEVHRSLSLLKIMKEQNIPYEIEQSKPGLSKAMELFNGALAAQEAEREEKEKQKKRKKRGKRKSRGFKL